MTLPATAGDRSAQDPPPPVAARRRRPVAARMALLAGAGFALLAGLDAALLLLGVGAPVRAERLAAVHGVVMVLGFVGTLIALERAVALGRRWGFAAPAATGLGAVALVSPAPLWAGGVLLMVGTGVQAALFVPLWRRRRDPAVLVQALGAASAFGGAMLFAGGADPRAYLCWLIGFVVLLIAGERMELARLGHRDRAHQDGAERLALAAGATLLGTVVLATLFPAWGYPVLGAALLLVVAALARVDVARRMLRSRGLPRFSAACLVAGYSWLALAGGILLVVPGPLDGGGYDAVVHSVFLGFTLSMIFAHAPVILPAVLRRPLPYHPAMYAPALLLHLALLVRVAGGDLRGARLVWQIGGVGNVVAVLAFVVTAVTASLVARVRRDTASRPAPHDPAPRTPAGATRAAPAGATRAAPAGAADPHRRATTGGRGREGLAP